MASQGKTILITGSTDGVGRHVALELATVGATVLIHGRSRERAESLLGEIRKRGNNAAAFYQADLSSLAEVRELAARIRKEHERLDALINNAGIGSRSGGAQRRTSAEGYELRFAVNYLAGFLLTRLLLPLIVASAPARIVNVASAGQYRIDFEDVMLTRGYDGGRAYAQSKLAQVMFTVDLAHELEGSGVTVNCLHPATYMDTTMVRRAASRRSARSTKEPPPSSISCGRQLSKAAAGSISIASANRGPTRRRMTRRRATACVA